MADTYLIAEIGTSHGGDLAKARELIDAARTCGADCAKFQYVIADEIVHANTGYVSLPGGAVALHERFVALERPPEFYAALREGCEEAGIDFLCTPFGIQSARALRTIGVTRLKVASPEVNHLPLLKEIASYGLPLLLSTGVTRLADIEAAVDAVGRSDTTILHCVTAYPAPEDQYNLLVMESLAAVLGVSVGVSDHSASPTLVPGLAAALGAAAIEKHFTLDKSGGGLDDAIALDPNEFTQMAATVRRVDAIRSLDPDTGRAKTIAAFKAEYGRKRIEAILGDGVKRLAPAEAASYPTTRRSIHAVAEIAEGATIAAVDVALLRTEAMLRPGLDPQWLDQVIGAVASSTIPAGEGIRFADLTLRGSA